jgi:4-amino-4-deoxy-L-arabinose transferase-like glycosyltransferase
MKKMATGKNLQNSITQIDTNRKNYIVIVIILGFMLRMIWLGYTQPIPVSDFEEYVQLAQGILSHGQFGFPMPSAYRLPAYPAFLAIMLLICNSILWLSIVNSILSTLLVYITYFLAIKVTKNHRIAILSAILCAINPTFVFFSPVIASEHLFSILVLLSMILAIDCENHRFNKLNSRYIIIGVLYGLAVLTRGEGLFYLPVIICIILLSRSKLIKKLIHIMMVVLFVSAMIIPWYIRNNMIVGEGAGLSTTSGINFYFAHNKQQYGWYLLCDPIFDGKNEIQKQQMGYQMGWEYIKNAGLSTLMKDVAIGTRRLFISSGNYSVFWSSRLPEKIDQVFLFKEKEIIGLYIFKKLTLFSLILFLGSVLAGIYWFRYTLNSRLALYGIILMNWIGYVCIFWGKARYRYTAEIIFCILTAMFLYEALRVQPFLDSNAMIKIKNFIRTYLIKIKTST